MLTLCQCNSLYEYGDNLMSTPAMPVAAGKSFTFSSLAQPAVFGVPWRLWLRPNGHLALGTLPASVPGGA